MNFCVPCAADTKHVRVCEQIIHEKNGKDESLERCPSKSNHKPIVRRRIRGIWSNLYFDIKTKMLCEKTNQISKM